MADAPGRPPGTSVPERPSIDGIEPIWIEQLGPRWPLPFRSLEVARADLLDRHAAADGVGLAAHGQRVRLHAHRLHRPLPAHARTRGVLPDGLGRQRARRPSGAWRTSSASAAIPTHPVRPGLRAPRRAPDAEGRDLAAELRRALQPSDRRRTSRRSRRSGGASDCRSTGPSSTRPWATARGGRASAPSSDCSLEARPTRPRRPRSGTSTSARRSPRPSSRIESTPAPTTASRSRASTPRAPSRSRRRAPSCSRRAWRSSRTPTTPATARCSARPSSPRSSTSASPSSPTSSPSPTRAAASPWCARSATRPTSSGGASSTCRCARSSAATGGSRRRRSASRATSPTTPKRRTWPTRSSPARPCKQAQATIVELLGATGALLGAPRPIQHPVKFYEKGERPLEIVTSRQWFIPTMPMRDRLLELGGAIDWLPPFMSHRYRAWVEGLNTDWSHQPAALLRRAVPGLVPHRRRRGRSTMPRRSSPGEDRLPVDPSTDVPDGFERVAARPAGRLRGRSRRDGHLGHELAHAADRRRLGGRPGPLRPRLPDGPAPAGPRDHPDVAVLDRRAQRARVRRPAVAPRDDQRVGPRPGPQEDVEVDRARRRPPCSSSRRSAPTACATGRRRDDPAPTPPTTPRR